MSSCSTPTTLLPCVPERLRDRVGTAQADFLGGIAHELHGALRPPAAGQRDADDFGQRGDAGSVIVGARRALGGAAAAVGR